MTTEAGLERMPARMETRRLLLRRWRADDVAALYRYARHPDVGPRAGWTAHRSIDESRAILREILIPPGNYAIVPHAVGHAVGSISLFPRQAAEHDDASGCTAEVELGFWIGEPYWGQGLISEAVAAMQRCAFVELGLDRLWCCYYEGNRQSQRVQEKCGFRYHHTDRNVERRLLGDRANSVVNCLTRDAWLEREDAHHQSP